MRSAGLIEYAMEFNRNDDDDGGIRFEASLAKARSFSSFLPSEAGNNFGVSVSNLACSAAQEVINDERGKLNFEITYLHPAS